VLGDPPVDAASTDDDERGVAGVYGERVLVD
jgi:hypothetical protein